MNKFADEAIIEVSSGRGGNGCIAFRREKFIPRGGPAGGDGGKGGDVRFEVRRNLRTLVNLRYRHSFHAENGQDGMGKNRHGKNGEDIVIPVPPGTVIKDPDTGEILKDFSKTEGSWLFLKGGNGGWGNTRYKTSVNQAPRFAQPGKPSQTVKLIVEMNVLADIGLVGFPNAGKSSLLDKFTNARPKIAPYPFTTKIPNLGMLTVGDRDIVIADIPGIMKGASEGAGLGIRFLKHISRTVALVFIVDLGEDEALTAFDILMEELEAFSPELGAKRRLIVGNKLDLEEASRRLAAIKGKYPLETVFGISIYSGEGLEELKKAILRFSNEGENGSPGEEPGI